MVDNATSVLEFCNPYRCGLVQDLVLLTSFRAQARRLGRRPDVSTFVLRHIGLCIHHCSSLRYGACSFSFDSA
jgi:hypothetical protein